MPQVATEQPSMNVFVPYEFPRVEPTKSSAVGSGESSRGIPELTGMDEAGLARYFRENFPNSSSQSTETFLEETFDSSVQESNGDTVENHRTKSHGIAVCLSCAGAEERGYAKGFDVGTGIAHEECRRSMDSNQAMFRDRLEKLCGSFESARATYFQRLRQETAGLALAIAERILHRELQLDPTLMRDAVHVALAQLSSSTRVKLRVPISEQTAWEEHFSLLNKSEGIPEILPDERMDPGECRIETELGSARLGISAQLEEIASRISRSATSTSRHLDRTPMDGSSLVDWQRNTPFPAQASTPEPDAPSNLGPTFQAAHGDQGARL